MSQKSSRSGALIISIGAIAYISAVTQRSTMGIASLVATDRFQTTAEQLSMLAVAQLIVYAAMQIPVGLLLDRWGPRRLLSIGALSMALGQYVVAFAPSLGLAVSGRMLVGFGDAFTFISMIRLINGWYSGKRASQLQQWLGNGGQVGQIVSAIPFSILLHAAGWQVSFTVWATIALIIGTLGLILIVDEPIKHAHDVGTLREQLGLLRKSVRSSSTRLAFWTHFMTQAPSNTLMLLWGFPFLAAAEGFTSDSAHLLLSSFVVIGFGFGFVFGQICAHRPHWRKFALSVSTSVMLVAWVTVVLKPEPMNTFQAGAWIFCTAMNSAASMVALDYSREYTPKSQLGAVNGIVNVGGFSAGFTMMFLIGVVLDVFYVAYGKSRGLPLYSLEGFRLAFISVPLIIGSGFLMYLKNEKITRNLHQLGLKP